MSTFWQDPVKKDSALNLNKEMKLFSLFKENHK